MWRYHYGPVAGSHGWFGIVGFVFWAAVIGVVIALIVRHHQYHHPEHASRHDQSLSAVSPLDVAKKRYARGEISQEEFTQIKKDLE